MISLSKGLSFPDEILTQTLGILAKRRAGKSYTARRFTEQLAENGHQVVIVDPKGDWWGIRSSATGKSRGLPITIFGGERGDVPLEKSAGELVAKLVVEERVSALLDLSNFRKAEVSVFMSDFLEALYRMKSRERFRTPLMLVIDEADAIAPQKPQPDQARMLGAAEDIVRRGGQRGIGCTMITQRSAVLNKNILTQCEVLIALKTIAPQDLKAIDAWIDVHGSEEERKTLKGSLPSLPVGDAWVWSPGWPTTDGIFKRIHVGKIKTFDSGATPKPGEKRVEPKAIADIDLEQIRRQMADVVERAAESDPKALRTRVRELERELEAARSQTPAVDEAALADARRAAQEMVDRVVNDFTDAARELARSAREAIDEILPVVDEVERLANQWASGGRIAFPSAPSKHPSPTPPRPAASASGAPADGLGGGCLRMLRALASRSPAGFTEAQWATLSKLKRTGGTWGTYKSKLKTAGYVEQRGELWHATDQGIAAAGEVPPAPETPDELLAMWKGSLGGGAARMLDAIALTGSRWLTLDDLAERVGITRSGGTFGTYLSKLKSNGLIEREGNGVRLSDVLR